MQKPDLFVSEDKDLLNIPMIIEFLKKTYWRKDAPEENIRKSMANSRCFGLYLNKTQIGFARVVTDQTYFAWLMDVFILDEFQRKGYGEVLLSEILNHPDLKDVRRWMLATLDAHTFYFKHGFSYLENPNRILERNVSLPL